MGKIVQLRARIYPYKWEFRTGFLFLHLFLVLLAFISVKKELHRINITLAILVSILIICEIVLAVKNLNWQNEKSQVIKTQGDGNKILQSYGFDPVTSYIMDYVQTKYSCCGIVDYRDWFTTNWATRAVSMLPNLPDGNKALQFTVWLSGSLWWTRVVDL